MVKLLFERKKKGQQDKIQGRKRSGAFKHSRDGSKSDISHNRRNIWGGGLRPRRIKNWWGAFANGAKKKVKTKDLHQGSQ